MLALSAVALLLLAVTRVDNVTKAVIRICLFVTLLQISSVYFLVLLRIHYQTQVYLELFNADVSYTRGT